MSARIASQIGYPLAGTVLLIALWAFLCVYGKVPTVVLPTPDKVLHAFIARFDLIVSEGWVTLKETLYGFILALVIGIPMAAALFGEPGLAIHITMVGLHGVILLTLPTALAELALAHAQARIHGASPLSSVMWMTVRNTLLHPVVLPIVAGLVWNLTGFGLHGVIDEALKLLGSAVVPVCLVLIGISLHAHGLGGRFADVLRAVLPVCTVKLVLLPALVLAVAHWGFGLAGVPLAVVVMMAALPVGSNALIFAQRYRLLEGEAAASIVVSTLAFVLTASLWLAVLAALSLGPTVAG